MVNMSGVSRAVLFTGRIMTRAAVTLMVGSNMMEEPTSNVIIYLISYPLTNGGLHTMSFEGFELIIGNGVSWAV